MVDLVLTYVEKYSLAIVAIGSSGLVDGHLAVQIHHGVFSIHGPNIASPSGLRRSDMHGLMRAQQNSSSVIAASTSLVFPPDIFTSPPERGD